MRLRALALAFSQSSGFFFFRYLSHCQPPLYHLPNRAGVAKATASFKRYRRSTCQAGLTVNVPLATHVLVVFGKVDIFSNQVLSVLSLLQHRIRLATHLFLHQPNSWPTAWHKHCRVFLRNALQNTGILFSQAISQVFRPGRRRMVEQPSQLRRLEVLIKQFPLRSYQS